MAYQCIYGGECDGCGACFPEAKDEWEDENDEEETEETEDEEEIESEED